MSHLLRRHAPITSDGWQAIDDEARERLIPSLGARRLVDFDGPKGWTLFRIEPRARLRDRGCADRRDRCIRAPGAAARRARRAFHDVAC